MAPGLTSQLREIGQLHGQLSRAYDDLACEVEKVVAGCAELSLHTPVESAPEPEFLTESDVAALLQVSARTVRRRVSEGKLPAPIRVSPRRLRWRRQDLDERLDQS